MKNLIASFLHHCLVPKPGPAPAAAISTSEPASGAAIPVLLTSNRNEDYLLIKGSLNEKRWLVVEARDAREATSLLQAAVFPIVVCDSDLCGSEWRTAVRDFAQARSRAIFVLVSDYWNPELWEQLRCEGGFDVLIRPLHKDDVSAVLAAAYQVWLARRDAMQAAAEPPHIVRQLRAAS